MKDEAPRPKAPFWTAAVLWAVAFFLFFPLVVMSLGAFQGPDGFTLEFFSAVLKNEYWTEALSRSLTIAACSSLLSALLGTGAALALEKSGGKILPGLLTLAMVVPELVFALILLTWFAMLMIPLSLVTVIVAHVTFSVSFTYLIVQGRLQKLDPSLLEAAADLGASPIQALIKVKLPLLVPAIVASVFVGFLLSFDDFLISFFVNGVGSDTLPIKLYASMKIGMTPELNALATMLAMASGLGLTVVFQSRTIQGIIQGSTRKT